jgi:hypothetical protein
MSKSVAREVIFFVLVFLLFYLGGKGLDMWHTKKPMLNSDVGLVVVGLVVTGLLVGIFYLAKLNQHTDGYKGFEISPGALCRGGAYLFSGDDSASKFCQNLAKSPEGRCEISRFNCPNGYQGLPSVPLEFSPNSDSCWSGVRCNKDGQVNHKWYKKNFPDHYGHGEGCNCAMCSMWTNQFTNTCKN